MSELKELFIFFGLHHGIYFVPVNRREDLSTVDVLRCQADVKDLWVGSGLCQPGMTRQDKRVKKCTWRKMLVLVCQGRGEGRYL